MINNKTPTGVNKLWDSLVGDPSSFSAQNRTVNALSIITLSMLLALTGISFLTDLNRVSLVLMVLVVLQAFLYYLSRVLKKFQLAIILYAIASYVALIVNYHYNSGIAGPTLLVFFLTFQLLLAITPKKFHALWAVKHIVVGIALMWAQYRRPQWAPLSYESEYAKYIDYAGTYIISLGFVYLITNYLISKYNHEKRIADEHAREIEEQNEKLKEISWMQSHKVRNHVTTIMGLTQLFNEKDLSDPVNESVIKGIITTSKELDEVVKNINALTE